MSVAHLRQLYRLRWGRNPSNCGCVPIPSAITAYPRTKTPDNPVAPASHSVILNKAEVIPNKAEVIPNKAEVIPNKAEVILSEAKNLSISSLLLPVLPHRAGKETSNFMSRTSDSGHQLHSRPSQFWLPSGVADSIPSLSRLNPSNPRSRLCRPRRQSRNLPDLCVLSAQIRVSSKRIRPHPPTT